MPPHERLIPYHLLRLNRRLIGCSKWNTWLFGEMNTGHYVLCNDDSFCCGIDDEVGSILAGLPSAYTKNLKPEKLGEWGQAASTVLPRQPWRASTGHIEFQRNISIKDEWSNLTKIDLCLSSKSLKRLMFPEGRSSNLTMIEFHFLRAFSPQHRLSSDNFWLN